MHHSSGEHYPPPDDDRYSRSERPFNPSQLLWRIWLLFRNRGRPARRTGTIRRRHATKQRTTRSLPRTLARIALRLLPVWVLLLVMLFAAPTLPRRVGASAVQWLREVVTRGEVVFSEIEPEDEPLPELQISPVFTQEVEYWAEDIGVWALTYELPANLVATVMQIESCGDPSVSSHVGATGLFQVMPFHFDPGEEHFDPETNAQAGMSFLASLLELSEGNISKALAGYNGGGSIMDALPETWPDETQRYVYWGTGIYEEALSDAEESTRLNEWLGAGGHVLCQGAAGSLGLTVTPVPITPTPEAAG